MMKYYKYYKKDSTHHAKKLNKKERRKIDSLDKAELKGKKLQRELNKRGIRGERQWVYSDSIQNELKKLKQIERDTAVSDSTKLLARKRIKQITSDRANKELAKRTLPGTRPYKMASHVKKELEKYWAILKDTTASDSARQVAKGKVKSITLEHAMKNPRFQAAYEQYQQYGQKPDMDMLGKQVPGLDTLQGVFDSSPDQLMAATETFAEQAATKAGGLGELSNASGELDKIKDQVADLSDPDKVKAQVKDKAMQEASDHFAGHMGKVQSAQAKVSQLLNKYREFSNSNDLSTAVKRTSLQGKSFKERIVLGGNFNVVSTEPFSLDLSPLVGYRLNTKFYIGLGANYRHTFSDSLKYRWHVSPTNSSLRLFANYDVFKNFFAYAEVERAGIKLKRNDVSNKKWRNNYFVGLGKKVLIHPKLYMTVTALYNLNSEKNNPSYPRRFQVRLGFQISDLAFRKKNTYYNP